MATADEKAPTFVQKPKLREDDEEDIIYFECVVAAFPKPKVVWYFNNKIVKKSKSTKLVQEVKVLGSNRFYIVLNLKDPEDSDSGQYKVVVTNKNGEATGSIKANFKAVEEHDPDQQAPVFVKKPGIRQDEDEEKLYFECIIAANPPPEISWYRDDKAVISKDRLKITCERKGNAYHCALIIDDADEEDGGKYKVTAKNNLGESSATINF